MNSTIVFETPYYINLCTWKCKAHYIQVAYKMLPCGLQSTKDKKKNYQSE